MIIWFASGNSDKRGELSRILNEKSEKWEVIIPSDRGIDFNPVEDEAEFSGNSLKKARELFKLIHEPVIADDSGLCVDALGGRPGVFSARYGSEGGKKLSSAERNALLLAELDGRSDRSACFVCSMCFLLEENRFFIAQETLKGEIARKESGAGGFGYDPLLYLKEEGCTAAELSAEVKNRISHRALAARRISAFLEEIYGAA